MWERSRVWREGSGGRVRLGRRLWLAQRECRWGRGGSGSSLSWLCCRVRVERRGGRWVIVTRRLWERSRTRSWGRSPRIAREARLLRLRLSFRRCGN